MGDPRDVTLSTPDESRSSGRPAGLFKRVLSTLVLLPILLAIVMVGPIWLFGATLVLIGAAAQ